LWQPVPRRLKSSPGTGALPNESLGALPRPPFPKFKEELKYFSPQRGLTKHGNKRFAPRSPAFPRGFGPSKRGKTLNPRFNYKPVRQEKCGHTSNPFGPFRTQEGQKKRFPKKTMG